MQNAGRKPTRRAPTHKPDRLTNPDVDAVQAKVHYSMAPFDREEQLMDAKWGIDLLPGLVTATMAGNYGFSVGKLNEAIEAHDPDLTEQWVGVCIRGLHAMDAEAEANGAPKANTAIWEYDLDGFKFGIMADDCAWQAIKADRPDLTLYTMREAAIALKAFNSPALEAVKKMGAKITKITPKQPPVDYAKGGDAIPF